MSTVHINTWDQLKKQIPDAMAQLIIEQFENGDPDWVIDICEEHNNNISPGSAFYIKDFHSYIPHTWVLDSQAIYKSIIYTPYNELKQ